MKKPDPEVGQIIRFDYLWCDEADRGRIEGAKDRPCAVIVARRREADGSQHVLLAPITHSSPQKGQAAIDIPARFSTMTGLDEARSWLIISEVNRVDWRDPGIVPAKQGQWLVGELPKSVTRQAVDTVLELARNRKLRMTRRDV